MRTKTRTTTQLKPGMVIRSVAYDRDGNLLDHAYRVVAANTKPTPWAERRITFTDGTYRMVSLSAEHQVVRGKTHRSAAKNRVGRSAGFVESALMFLGAYAVKAV